MDRFHSSSDGTVSDWLISSDDFVSQDDNEHQRAIDDADNLIQFLGPEAKTTVAAGATAQFGEWLGWPDWLTHGTSLINDGKLPDRITLSDDLIILANMVDHGKSAEILTRLTGDFRIPGAPITVPALYNAPTLFDALQFFVRTAAFGSPFLKIDFQQDSERFSIFIGSEMRKGELRDFCSAAMLSIAYRFVSFFVIDDCDNILIEMDAPRNVPITNSFANLPGTFKLDAGRYAIHGNSAWLNLENIRTDKAFWNFALERMTVAEREGNRSDIVRRIRSAICRTMENECRVPRLKQIAASEQVSERTLVRALALQGIRFHQIVEEERRLKASELIGNASLSLTEIAKMLGFTDMSSFGRSYRQWFGVTPGQARSRRGA